MSVIWWEQWEQWIVRVPSGRGNERSMFSLSTLMLWILIANVKGYLLIIFNWIISIDLTEKIIYEVINVTKSKNYRQVGFYDNF